MLSTDMIESLFIMEIIDGLIIKITVNYQYTFVGHLQMSKI